MTGTIGLPAETKTGEGRVALDPVAVHGLAGDGLDVRVERGAGVAAGFGDGEYEAAGATIVPRAADVWAADLVVKVKEPQEAEFAYFRPGLVLFAYLHLAAEPALAEALVAARVEAYAFETLQDRGRLPLLAPMSEIAGRSAAIIAGSTLAAQHGGSGTLLGGAAGVPPARAVVIGLGVAGTAAARGLRGLDAEVLGVDVDLDRLWQAGLSGTVSGTLVSADAAVAGALVDADVVIGAALIPGARAPVVVCEEHVEAMRPGAVVVDLAVDQGGCVATTRPMTLSERPYEVGGVVHYCVTNVPGQYPRTASRALSAAIAPWVGRLAADPSHPALTSARNTSDGAIVHPAVAAALALPTKASAQEG